MEKIEFLEGERQSGRNFVVFEKLKRFCERNGYNYGKTEDHYIVGGINNIYGLMYVLDYLNIQNKYEVFIETERINDEIIYSVAGEKI